MHSAFIVLNNIPTRVTTWGKWIEESFDKNESKDIILFIPGNPGVTKYYDHFLEVLHQQLGWPVWIVGHTGCERPDNENLYTFPPLSENNDLYNLEGQVTHKKEFIDRYIPSDARIHFIGHSVGTYIICQLLKDPSIKKRVVYNYLMFPTLEHIAKTPNGKVYTAFFSKIVFITLFLTWIFSILPKVVQVLLLQIYLFVTGTSAIHTEAIINMLTPQVLEKIFFLATDEMYKLKDRENAVIEENLDKIYVYFGRTDGWSPVSYYDALKKDFPNIKGEVCTHNFAHAFVLRNSKEVGLMVANWIRNFEN